MINIIIFDEKKYGKSIFKSGFKTYKGRNIERCVLIRYLYNEGYSKENILEELKRNTIKGDIFISKNDIELIYNKLIDKALLYDYPSNVEIKIYRNELLKIMEIKNEKIEKLMFSILIYYKWALNIPSYYFERGKNKDRWVEDKIDDCFKMCGLANKKKRDKIKTLNYLVSQEYYSSEVINRRGKIKTYFFIPFCENKGEEYNIVNEYSDLPGLYLYLIGKNIKCINCGKYVEKKSNSQRYCRECSLINIKKSKKKYWDSYTRKIEND